MAYMNYAYLLHTEDETRAAFTIDQPTFVVLFPQLLDVLFQIPYFIEHPKPAPDDGMHFFCLERLVNAPYTLRALYILCERGHYVEAITLIRHALETFVQVRYFAKHPDKLKLHITSLSSAGKVRFKTMFEEFAPGYYQKFYGRLFSNISHAGVAISVFVTGIIKPTEAEGPVEAEQRLGCKYDPIATGFIVNQVYTLIFGYLTCAPDWFASYTKKAPKDIEDERQVALSALNEYLNNHLKQFPKSEEWHKLTDLLIARAKGV